MSWGDQAGPEVGSNDFGEGGDRRHLQMSEEDSNTFINSGLIQRITAETHKSFTRNRRVRVKLLLKILMYFRKVCENAEKDATIQSKLLECFEDIQELILTTAKLCVLLSEPASKIGEIYEIIFDLGAQFETIFIAIYTRCKDTGIFYGDLVKNHLNSLLKMSCENPQSWLYSELLSTVVLNILSIFFEADHSDFRVDWAKTAFEIMKSFSKPIFGCGDFGCQYYLVSVFHMWSQWQNSGRVLPLLNSAFPYVRADARKELLISVDPELRVRTFLDALNTSPRGPKSVIPVQCLYVFIGDNKLNSATELWVNFSIGSGRLHVYRYLPNNTLTPITIRKDQIDSICFNWVVHDGKETDTQTQQLSPSDTQSSTATFKKDEKVLFFHMVLTEDFGTITTSIEEYIGKNLRSIYFVIREGQSVENVMTRMGYTQHVCGSMGCQHPRTMRRMLASENKLSYSQNWCPEFPVVGLDKSPDGLGKSFLNRSSDQFSTPARLKRRSPFSKKGTPARGESFSIDYSSGESSSHATQEDDQSAISSVFPKTPGSDYHRKVLAGHTPSKQGPVVPNKRETPTAFYVSVSTSGTSRNESEVQKQEKSPEENENPLNASTVTLFEDPLPKNLRKRAAEVFKHIPFYKSSPVKQNKNQEPKRDAALTPLINNQSFVTTPVQTKAIRNSSPKSDARFQVTTPIMSEIGSPPINVFNETMIDCDFPGPLTQKQNIKSTKNVDDESDLETVPSPVVSGQGLSSIVGYSKILGSPPINVVNETMIDCDFPEPLTQKKNVESTKNVDDESDLETLYSPVSSQGLSPIVGYSKILGSPPINVVNETMIDCDFPEPLTKKKKNVENTKNVDDESDLKTLYSPVSSQGLSPIVGYSKILGSPPINVVNETMIDCDSPELLTQKKNVESTKNVDEETDLLIPPSPLSSQGLSPINGYSKTLGNPSINVVNETMIDCDFPEPLTQKQNVESTKNVDDESDLEALPSPLSSQGLSPIVGYSKTLGSRIEKFEETFDGGRDILKTVCHDKAAKSALVASENEKLQHTSSKNKHSRKSTNKLPCYAYAYQTSRNRLAEKMAKADYDPYDMTTCSEMEEYKDQLFPERKLRTYPGPKNKRKPTSRVKREKKKKQKGEHGLKRLQINSPKPKQKLSPGKELAEKSVRFLLPLKSYKASKGRGRD